MDEIRDVITPAEASLLVFMCGRIRPELVALRDQVEAALRAWPFVRAWRFERTPPSSESLDDSYLRHARDADFLLWLADEEISDAVEKELATAIEAKVPILVFLLAPPERRSAALTEILGKFRSQVRTCNLFEHEALASAVQLAIGEELVRALRGVGAPSRKRLLLAAGLDSRARIIARLRAAGLSAGRAPAFADAVADDQPIGDYIPHGDAPLRILVGEVGAGKSLIAERALQATIRRALDDPVAPVPLYSRLDSVTGSLGEWITAAAKGIGDPRSVGTFVVLDGADEPGAWRPARILEESRTVASSFPDTRILVTSRPLPGLSSADEVVRIGPLSDDRAEELIARARGENTNLVRLHFLDPNLREAVRFPAFAIMYGVLGSGAAAQPQTRGDVIRALIDRALGGRVDLQRELVDLAAAATEAGRGSVHRTEVGAYGDLQRVLNTALVVEEGANVRFGLAILQEWFAAQYLLRPQTFETVLSDERRRDRWRQAIALAVNEAAPARANQMLTVLTSTDLGLAAQIISELKASGYRPDPRPLMRPARVYGEEIQLATSGLATAFAPLGRDLFRLDPQGRPRTLYVGVDGSHLLYGVPRVAEGESVRVLEDGQLREDRWTVRGHLTVEDRAGWAWNFALDRGRDRLRAMLQAGALHVSDSPAYDAEMAWLLACELVQRGSADPRPFPIESLLTHRDWLRAGEWVRRRNALIPTTPLVALLDQPGGLNVAAFGSPWPAPDLDRSRGNWVWAPYSAQRLLELTQAVYAAALDIYRGLVRGNFPSLSERLWHWRVLPAKFSGVLDPGAPDTFEHRPVIHYDFEPLAPAQADTVDIRLGQHADLPPLERLSSVFEQRRPRAAAWLYASGMSAALEVFGFAPATRLAYQWLAQDLSGLGLFSGASFGPEW